ncbi:NADH:flavin oxidoreductase/NADH oxidase, partial [Klebsiella pneumoniae]|nr:NADH:flavin oxidoreductase/NADH oxidase [Klebsiella pneumoniae]
MSHLFEPIKLRDLVVSNRAWVSPMCQYSAEDGLPNDWHLVHLGQFATGGAGLIVTEATAVVPEGRISPGDTGLWNDEQTEAWRRINDFLHQQGAATAIQLAHAGRKASTTAMWE